MQIFYTKHFKKILLFTFIVMGGNLLFAQSDTMKIAEWTFEKNPPSNTAPQSYTADSGSGTATAFHTGNATYSSPAGNGSPHSFSSNTWVVGDYYQFQVSAAGVSTADTFKFIFDQTGSGTGPKDFKIQTSADGSNFTDLSGASYSLLTPAVVWVAKGSPKTTSTYSFDLPASLIGQSNVDVRITNTTTTSITGGTVAGGGTDRVDNVRFLAITKDNTTPVTLYSFTATKISNGALLNWTTTTEINSSHFVIEKSSDGKTFTPIKTIPSQNNPSGASYSYTDNTYKGGIAFYQLKMFDLDGNSKPSRIIPVSGANVNSVSLKYTYVKDKVELNNIQSTANARIINVSGVMVANQSVSNSNPTINVATLPAGIYFIQLSNSNKKNLKFIKQ